jgi:hypothetical protein
VERDRVQPGVAVRVPKGTNKALQVWTAQDAKRSLDALAVTLDTYSHVPQAVRRDGADKIAALFGD